MNHSVDQIRSRRQPSGPGPSLRRIERLHRRGLELLTDEIAPAALAETADARRMRDRPGPAAALARLAGWVDAVSAPGREAALAPAPLQQAMRDAFLCAVAKGGVAVDPDRMDGPVLTPMTLAAALDEIIRQIAAKIDGATGASVVVAHDAWCAQRLDEAARRVRANRAQAGRSAR